MENPHRRPGSKGRPVGAHPSRTTTDALLLAAGRGDRDAFATFYDRTAPTVFGMLHDGLGQPAAAEYATTEVYLWMWRAAPGFDPTTRSAFATLLLTTRRELTTRIHCFLTTTPRADPDTPTAGASTSSTLS